MCCTWHLRDIDWLWTSRKLYEPFRRSQPSWSSVIGGNSLRAIDMWETSLPFPVSLPLFGCLLAQWTSSVGRREKCASPLSRISALWHSQCGPMQSARMLFSCRQRRVRLRRICWETDTRYSQLKRHIGQRISQVRHSVICARSSVWSQRTRSDLTFSAMPRSSYTWFVGWTESIRQRPHRIVARSCPPWSCHESSDENVQSSPSSRFRKKVQRGCQSQFSTLSDRDLAEA